MSNISMKVDHRRKNHTQETVYNLQEIFIVIILKDEPAILTITETPEDRNLLQLELEYEDPLMP